MPLGRIDKNTSELWDEVWARDAGPDEDRHALAKERVGARFQRMSKEVIRRFGTFEDLKVIEIGAGAGTNAALFGALGSDVTVLDYSAKALERSRVFFERNELSARQVHADALDLPADTLESFDISISFGLAEHFVGEDRVRIIRSHLDVLRPNGVSFISVPNRANPPYRVYKLLTQRTRLWNVGEEYPFSRHELASICSRLGVREYSFFGDSLLESFRFVNPIALARKVRRKQPPTGQQRVRVQRGTFLDERLAYALVLCAARPS
jgi:2-polyprenyl-3-methyl-5-hydroxy-6-metoxy-1,4-benzoquinol methylase